MTDNTNRNPSHRAYVVQGEGEKARWTEIGAAWPNADEQGFVIVLDALPVNGRVVLRTPKGGQS